MKRKIFILGIMLLILSPLRIYAAEQVSMVCDKTTAKPGDQISCDIKLSTTIEVTAVEGNIATSDNLEFVSVVPMSDFVFQGGAIDEKEKKITLTREVVIKDEFVAGKVILKVKSDAKSGDATIELTNASIGNDKGKMYDITSNKTTIKIEVPVVKGLKSLNISKGYIKDSSFSSSREGYTVIIEGNTFGLSMTANNSSDNIVVTDGKGNTINDVNNIKFDPNDSGLMLLYIGVGSGDTAFKYTLSVSKDVDDDYRGYLSKLVIGGVNVELTRGKTEYTIYLDNISSYDISAYLEDSENFMIENGGISKGNGSWVNIKIVPKDPSSGAKSITYTINVLKKGSSSNGTNNSSNNASKSPQTGDISMFFMALILISSLVGSLYLYKKNLVDLKK